MALQDSGARNAPCRVVCVLELEGTIGSEGFEQCAHYAAMMAGEAETAYAAELPWRCDSLM